MSLPSKPGTYQFQNLDKPASVICLGAAQYGSQMDEKSSLALLERFAECGGNFIDTAHIYGAWDRNGANGGTGNSEVVIGRWMHRNGCREEMIVGTKGGHPDFDTGESGMTQEALNRHIRESLERLQTDYIDIYWLHRDDRSIPAAEILGWLVEPVRSGVVRVLGCSHWRIDRILEASEAAAGLGLPLVQASQIAWSLAQETQPISSGRFGEQLAMDDETWNFHSHRQIPLVAYNSQAGGFFAAKYDNLDFAAKDFPKPGLTRKYGCDLNYRRRQVADRLAREKGCTTNQIALAWLLNQPFPVLSIIGPRNLEQLDDSLGAASLSLNSEEVEMLRKGGW